jgi:cytochrome P450
MDALEAYDLLDPRTVEDPYPFYAALREHAPVYCVPGTGVYLVSRRQQIEEVLDRQNDFSANLTGVLMTGASGRPEVFDLTRFGSAVDAIANADEPSHSVHRRLVLPSLSQKGVTALETTLRRWAIERIDSLVAEGGGDFVDRVANPIPTRAMAHVVGLPLEDADRLLEWAMAGTEILAGTTTPERMGTIAIKTAEMAAYLGGQLRRAMDAPEDQPVPGVIADLARGVDEGLISGHDGVSILIVLAGAGGESTSSLTGSAARLLANLPELQRELRASPRLIPDFVEEAVRLESPFRGHYRVARRDTQLGGVDLHEGARVMLLWAAANRDPETFENPDVVDIRRPNPSAHIAFGRGIHFCVGARLARLEVRIILEELLARTRSFSLDPDHPPHYVSSIFVRRHATLPLIAKGS